MSSGFNTGFLQGTLGAAQGFGAGFTAAAEVAGPISSGLVLQYDIGNVASYPGSGNTVYDLQGNSNATLVNSPTYSSGYLQFDGTNEYLMTNTSLASKVTTDITSISMWAYPMDNGVLLSEQGSTSLNAGWHDSQMEMVAGTMKFGMWSGVGITSVTSAIATPLNSWYNFTIVYNGTKLTAYVNGTNAGEVTFARMNPIEGGAGIHYAIAAQDFTSMGDGGYANMRLGQFLVYSVALTADQVLENFNATRTTYGI